MFDFTGTSNRAEYFTHTVVSGFFTSFVVLTIMIANSLVLNWYVILPPEMLNDEGQPSLWPRIPGQYLPFFLLALIVVMRFPVFALTIRRLRDQLANPAAYLWFLFFPPALFFYGFVPTFRDYPVTLPDGTVTMRSRELIARQWRNNAIGAVLISLGIGAVVRGMNNSVGGMELQGGAPVKGRGGELFHADGSFNNANNILGGRKAHMRNGRSVRASHNKFTL
ncbi:hypothetical protein LJ759_15895 [Arthrobacter sp. zg-Y1110]|nr:hypothetical protein [Arthrobacter sp. zg-Y1110]MCC3292435.1 hypothetical protein [Arthrobacter sp. zg-Y1110]